VAGKHLIVPNAFAAQNRVKNAPLGTSSLSRYNSTEQQLLLYQWVSNDVGTIAAKAGSWTAGTWKAEVGIWPVPPATKPSRRGRTAKSTAAVPGMTPRTGNPGFNAPAVAEAQPSSVTKGNPLEALTDAEVMLRVGAGDDAAFDYLVEKFRRPMVSFMYRMAHNQAVAEELAQEVFLRVYRSRSSYAADAKFTTWLYRIATNLAVNHARDTRQERTADTVCLDEPDEETGTTVDVADK